MNKQNFTSKFSNILEEERQNQSREMNGGKTETFGGRKSDHSSQRTAEREIVSSLETPTL